mgnify:CR=1 FL=1
MQRYDIIVSPGALRDLEDFSDYISKHDDPAKAGHVIARIEAVIDRLATSPERGSFLPELISLGMKNYRQIFAKPYRVIYRVQAETVRVYLVADGRRNLPALLSRRLLSQLPVHFFSISKWHG